MIQSLVFLEGSHKQLHEIFKDSLIPAGNGKVQFNAILVILINQSEADL